MKKFNQLNQKLEKLESQKILLTTLEDISILQFLKYKKIISEESKIKRQLKKSQILAKEANFIYDINTKSWIKNQNMNCRVYHKLQQKAEYQRDMKLYKLGYLNKKPLSPLLKKISTYLPKFDFSKFNFLKKFNNKHFSFKSNLLSQKVNNLAVDTAKIGIKGYRKFRSNCKFFRNYITSRNSFKYLKSILEEAKIQVDQSEIANGYQSRSITKSGVQFRESLKFNTDRIGITCNISREKISYPSPRRKIVLDNRAEYTL